MHWLIRLVALLIVAAGNYVALMLMLALVFMAGEGFWGGSGMMPPWVAVAAGVAVVGLGVLSASPWGERVSRLFDPIRPVTKQEEAKLGSAFDRVRAAWAAQLNRRLDVELFMIDDPMPQAMALGRGTIAVTRGALDVAEESELAGVLAHESGHLHHRDSMFTSALIGMNSISNLQAAVVWISLPLLSGFMALAVMVPLAAVILALVFPWVALLVIAVPIVLGAGFLLNLTINWVVSLLLRLANRSVEYRADRFAAELGFGPGLVGFLERLAGMEAETEHGFMVMYLQSHPPTAVRIYRLEVMQGVEAAA